MKQRILIFLSMLLLLSLTACGIHDNVDFYYCRTNFIYNSQNSAISKETRDVTGHTEDLPYLLALYLVGPLDENLQSPFPVNTRLINVTQEGSTLILQLSRQADMLNDSDFSLACACLTMTCIEISEASDVTIICEDRTVTMNRDLLILHDVTTTETTDGGN